jgi:hypothetical protein
MFGSDKKEVKQAAFPGNGSFTVQTFNPPVKLPEIDPETGDVKRDAEGLPLFRLVNMILTGSLETLDSDGELFSISKLDGNLAPKNVKTLAGALADEILKEFVSQKPGVQILVAPRHDSRIPTHEKSFEKALNSRDESRRKLATLKEKAQILARKRTEKAEADNRKKPKKTS